MRKLLTAITPGILFFQIAFCQAYEGKVEYQKKDEDAIIAEYPYPPSVVEDAIVDKMAKMGYKGKDSRGFRTYSNITLSEINKDPMDYMVRVDRKSRKDKDESIVYLVMKTSGSNPIAETNIKENAKSFLNSLSPVIEAYNLEQGILAQEEIVKKAEKKYSNLQDDQQDLEKRKRKLENDIDDNRKDQDKQKQEIEKQRQVLEALRGKRRN